MSRILVENSPFESFPNYTDDMYLGNKPSRKGGIYVVDGEEVDCDVYAYKFGSVDVVNDKVMHADVTVNHKTSVIIIGNMLSVQVMRYYKGFAIWKYWTNKSYWNPNLRDYGQDAMLDAVSAERILNRLNRCHADRLVKYRAKELLNEYLLTNY